MSNIKLRYGPSSGDDHYQRFVDNTFWNWNFDQFPFAAEPNPRTEGISLSIGESRSDARFETSFGSGPSRHTALPHELGRYPVEISMQKAIQ
jgi:hypothetical protein